MTEKTGLVPNKPYYAIYQNPATALLYSEDAPKRLMYIDCCDICRFKEEGAEDGGKINRNSGSHDFEEKDIWYYCVHPSFTGWPKRIGQSDKTNVIPYFCPLESIIRVNDDLIKTVEEPKKERVKKAVPVTPQKEQSDLQTQPIEVPATIK
jgi:hypothetical protein